MANKLYECTEDRQGGNWCVGLVQTAEEWLEDAIYWRNSDWSWDEDNGDTEDNMRKRGKELIAKGEEEKVIEYIDDMWSITLEFVGHEEEKGE